MAAADRYLDGLFAPVTTEVAAYGLRVTGRVPPELDGRYLRNGPNPLGLDEPGAYHVYLGDGMVHGVRLRGGRAEWYRNRWVRSRRVADALGERPRGRPYGAVGSADPSPERTPASGDAGRAGAGDAALDLPDFAPNTHVIGHAGRTYALVEAGPRPYELTYELETVGPSDFDGTLPGPFTAHTKRDPRTGELHAVAYHRGRDHLQYLVVDAAGRVTRADDIAVPDRPMVHDLALTRRFAIVYDLPVTFDPELAAAGSLLPYAWNRAHPARIGLVSRDGPGAGVRWCDVEPAWVFHTVNAYDDGDRADGGGRVVLDVIRYRRMLEHGEMAGNGEPVLARWSVDPASGRVSEQVLDDRPQELPHVDGRVVGGRHRYAYTATGDHMFETGAGNALIKHDLVTGSSAVRAFPAGSGVGEPVFVPAAPDAAEDDGYVMTLFYAPARGTTDLLILAAGDFTGDPVATVHLPARVPLGFHGSWVPDAPELFEPRDAR